MELPAVLKQGERSRLFPVLADTSKEGRTLSIILACLENVSEFQRGFLAALGQRLGARSRVEAYTEVVLAKGGEKKHRPDGLIILRHGPKQWSALVEAKVGNAELTPEQLEGYLDLAKLNGIDALLTLSNQFAPLPTHHPVQLPLAVRKKAELYHCSWMFVLTQASLLLRNGEISDPLQRVLLNEMERFLLHPSAGVRGFDQMPAAWSELVNRVHAGAKLSANSQEAREVAGAWHQELRDLSLILSRQLKAEVTTRVPRAHAADPSARLKAAVGDLSENHCLAGTLIVPGAAAPIEICADIQKRSIGVSMKLRRRGIERAPKRGWAGCFGRSNVRKEKTSTFGYSGPAVGGIASSHFPASERTPTFRPQSGLGLQCYRSRSFW